MNSKIKNITTEVLSDDWYTLNKINFDYKLRNGNWVNQSRESYDRGNGATILLYNASKKTVILVKQFRMPSYLNGNKTGMMIESCAGLLDGDAPIACVIKEAEEETGYRIKNAVKVFEAYMSPGAVTEIVHFFIAQYDDSMKISVGGGLDVEHEDIEILEVDFKQALHMIKIGEIKDAKTIILLQYAHINKLME
ncbi:MAG: GDP-mannose pyrophosphatase NudK [Flavobacteriaceae bacterium]|nr:GDP-mannose pyrophosphatase NudK [Flavobacteriaceae bacterium]